MQPGSYSIVANGYGVGERNGVAATGGSFGSLAQTEAIQFVGTSRFAPGTSTAYPTSVDIGPANRYGAGTFAFDDATGEVVFAAGSVPGEGLAVTCGYQFDVPVRFDTDRLEISLKAFKAGQIPSIPLIEVLS